MTTFKGLYEWYKGGQRQTSDVFIRVGRARTVWVCGVIIFGGSMFLITCGLDLISRLHEVHGKSAAGWLTLSLAVWMIIGYVFGLFLWQRAKSTS